MFPEIHTAMLKDLLNFFDNNPIATTVIMGLGFFALCCYIRLRNEREKNKHLSLAIKKDHEDAEEEKLVIRPINYKNFHDDNLNSVYQIFIREEEYEEAQKCHDELALRCIESTIMTNGCIE